MGPRRTQDILPGLWFRFDANGPACAVARPRTPVRRSQAAQRYRLLFGGVSHVGGVIGRQRRLLQRARVNARAHGGGSGGAHKGELLAWAGIRDLNQAAWEVHRLRYLFHEPRAHPRAGAQIVNVLVLVSQARRQRVGWPICRRHVTRIAQRPDGCYPQQLTAVRLASVSAAGDRAKQQA